MPIYQAEELRVFTREVLERIGLKNECAYNASDALIRANLEGVDSHGISRLSIYAKRIMEGRINADPEIKIEKKGSSVLVVDGDNGLGQAVSAKAMSEGLSLVKESGAVAVSVKNSNHFGTASYFCQMAAERGVVALAFTNSPSGIPPWGGTKAFFGTNPIAFGFPTGTKEPVIIDMSTSVVARGKIILAAKQGQSIPKGWAIDEEGNETEDAKEALKGAVLPVGGAKGYALALAVEVLTGLLSGAAFGPHVQNIYDNGADQANVGHFFILLDVEKFMPEGVFYSLMEQLLSEIKETPKAEGVEEILYPGERRARALSKNLEQGIELSEQVEEELRILGSNLNVDLPKRSICRNSL
ncbi:lactate dehydrogenase [Alkalihalophilus pseudofirmus]|uniref:Ldh family oxidoreductase n=1 Tax=Alkalihalophilus pseudofirmus TaxID=79885 RepID=UPI0009523613|nr:lactate dehydrogenase [Alkalihalophilus pseudofirmus]